MSQDDVRLSPDLIAQLNALASRLTQMGEYEACDLIDTVVARVTAMPQRELLRDALSALEPFAKEAAEWGVNGKSLPDDFQIEVREAGYPATPALFSLGDLRRARAAADKIRAALTQEKQT